MNSKVDVAREFMQKMQHLSQEQNDMSRKFLPLLLTRTLETQRDLDPAKAIERNFFSKKSNNSL